MFAVLFSITILNSLIGKVFSSDVAVNQLCLEITQSNSASQSTAPQFGTAMPRYVISSSSNLTSLQACQNGTASEEKIIRLLATVNYGGMLGEGQMVVKAIQLALDSLSQFSKTGFLGHYELVVELLDDGSEHALINDRLMRRLRQNDEDPRGKLLPIIIGTGFVSNEKVLGTGLSNFGLFAINAIVKQAEVFYNRSRFSSIFSLWEPDFRVREGLAKMVGSFGWKKLAILSEIAPSGLSEFHSSMEPILVKAFEQENITLVWYGKVWIEDSPESIDETFKELASKMPRIIVVHAATLETACYLHKHGLYGPAFVLFIDNYTPMLIMPIFGRIATWCTREMIDEVMASFIFFGGRTKHADDDMDISGRTIGEYTKDLLARVPDIGHPLFLLDRFYLYDTMLLVGNVLQRGYEESRRINKSLLEIGESEMKTYLFKLPVVKGLNGVYKFEEATGANTGGYTTWSFSQFDRKTLYRQIATFQHNRSPHEVVIEFSQVRWRTSDGLAPSDSQLVLSTEQSPFNYSFSWSLIGISIVLSVGLISIVVAMRSRKLAAQRAFSRFEINLCLANLIFISKAFALPQNLTLSKIAEHCTVFTVLTVVGFALANALIWFEAEVLYRNRQRIRVFKHLFTAIIVTSLILLGIAIILWPFQVMIIHLPSYTVNGVLIEPFSKSCQVLYSKFSETGIYALVVIFLFIHVALMLRTAFIMYYASRMPSLSSNMATLSIISKAKLKAIGTATYSQLSLVFVTILICLTLAPALAMPIVCVGTLAMSLAQLLPIMLVAFTKTVAEEDLRLRNAAPTNKPNVNPRQA